MSNKKKETIADIVAEMRRECPARHMDGTVYSECDWVYTKGTVKELADRIEAANSRSYDKYKEDTNELNRQILVLKHEKEMSDTYFCGYDPEEALVAQCSTCRFYKKKHSYCTLNDSLTNARYKCSGWKFKTNKECADEYKASLKNEYEKLRDENARLRAALKVAEDALEKIDNMCDGDMCKFFDNTHHCSACRYLDECQTGVAHAALHEIRGEGAK